MDIQKSIVGILNGDGEIIGTGFLVGDKTILTCAHVIKAAKSEPGEQVTIRFAVDNSDVVASVDSDSWSPVEEHDLALLRVKQKPTDATTLSLGVSSGTSGHAFRTYGYATIGGVQGLGARGEIIDVVEDGNLLQITSQEIDRGFSGAPIIDEARRVVVGMITWGKISTTTQRGRDTTFAVTTEAIQTVVPELKFSDICPYRSLDVFTEEDDEFFYGRQRVIERLLDSLKREPRFLAVLGPSGSGKSSVVRAGLVPALKKGKLPGSKKWGVLTVRPGEQPFEQLAGVGLVCDAGNKLVETVKGWLKSHPEYTRLVLIIDQFEELLVNVPEDLRQSFVTGLAELLDAPVELSLVLTMRDDFYSRFQQMAAPLAPWLERGLANIPNVLTEDELREIILAPARKVGLDFEKGLEEAIIEDALDTSGSARSTILPLLEFTLTQLWEERQDGRLCHNSYRDLGGVSGGLSQWADHTFNAMSKEDRLLARRILTDLVHVGEPSQELPDSKRRRAISDLYSEPEEQESAYRVAGILADARLLSTGLDKDVESAELIHDALLREWGQLRSWLDEDRHFLTWRQKIEERAWEWKLGTAELLRGHELAEAQGYWEERQGELQEICEYISISIRQARKQRNMLISIISTVLLVFAVLAYWGQSKAIEAQDHAATANAASILAIANEATAQAERDRANEQAQIARAREISAQAIALQDINFTVASLLSIEAFRSLPNNTQTRAALFELLKANPKLNQRLYKHTGAVTSIAIHPNGQMFASASEDSDIILWDVETGQAIGEPLTGHSGPVWSVTFSPDGKTLASSGEDSNIILWDVETGQAIGQPLVGHSGAIWDVEFSPSGETLASGGGDNTIILWDVETGQAIGQPLTGHSGTIWDVEFSPNGKILASCSFDTTVILWDVETLQPLGEPLEGHDYSVEDIIFSPDGSILASGSRDNRIILWDVQEREYKATLRGHTNTVLSLAFSPDGKILASSSYDHSINLWNVELQHPIDKPLLTHTDGVESIAFTPDGKKLISGSDDETIIIWELDPLNPIVENQSMNPDGDFFETVAYSPDGKYIVTADVGGNEYLIVWESESLTPIN